MEIATRQRGRALALAQLIETAVQRGPQLLVVEDVHWADTDELARFGEIAAVVANCQILFIMTTRPEGDPINASWRARARGCPVTTVDLAPLAEDEAQELAAHFPELPQETIAGVHPARRRPSAVSRSAAACRTRGTRPVAWIGALGRVWRVPPGCPLAITRPCKPLPFSAIARR